MKILIGYDGSNVADSALDDLKMAGLPEIAEVLIVSVAEVWLPPPEEKVLQYEYETADGYLAKQVRSLQLKGEKFLQESQVFAKFAQERLQKMFPQWTVSTLATYGSPAWEIVTQADSWKPDLIVVGSHGKSGVSRYFLGSVSQRVLNEAKCSVRIARGKIDVDETPNRLVIGYDGSSGADFAVEQVIKRNWENCEVHLITVKDSIMPTAIGRFVAPVVSWVEEENELETDWIEDFAEKALKNLRAANIKTEFKILEGHPATVLVNYAQEWSADCIFVGATGYSNKIERFLLGSVSSAVAVRAGCSVEVVRKQKI